MQIRNRTIADSFSCAIQGIKDTVLGERNMRIHLSVALLVVYFAYHLQFSVVEWCLLVLAIGSVFAGEVFNTAIEHTIDAKVDEYQEFARKAKDAAAGGELVMACMAAAVGLILFLSNGRLHMMWQLCTGSVIRFAALVLYCAIAGWFIFSGKRQKIRRKKD